MARGADCVGTDASLEGQFLWWKLFQSVSGVNYFLERSGNLGLPFALLGTNIVGQAGTTSYAVTNATVVGPYFCRVGVEAP
jgi:hypothetical protein